MIEKRFTYEYNGNLFDNKMNTFYHIEDSEENIEVLCDRLNWLVEENEQLKQQLKTKVIVNKQYEELQRVKKENEKLRDIRLNYSENHREFNKDKLYFKDNNIEIDLKNNNLDITIFIPQIKEFLRFSYFVTGKNLEREYIYKRKHDE